MSPQLTGLAQDEYFDLTIDPTGDVAKSHDLEEVSKDISGTVTEIVRASSFGMPIESNRKQEIESRIETAISENDWCLEVQSIVRGDPNNDALAIDLLVITSLGIIEEVELVSV